MSSPRETAHRVGSPGLRAGAAQVDITPEAGVHLTGAIDLHRPAELVADPLYAKAVVFESGGRKLCFLALDVTIVTGEYSARIRREAAERFGFDPDAIMVHATQTHSAPSLGRFMVDRDFEGVPAEHEWVGGDEERYSEWAADRAIEAIGQANEALQPVRIGVGSGIEGRLAFNRRAVRQDGTVTMPGRAWTDGPVGPNPTRYLEGPIDPELGVVCLRTDSMSIPAMLVHHTCHPVHYYPKRIVSADWPGTWSAELQKAYGAGCVPLVLNGACGNINPWSPFDPDFVPDCARMGRVLAERAGKVIEALTFGDRAALDWTSRHVRLPLREVPAKELAWAQDILAKSLQVAWVDQEPRQVQPDWMVAASIYSVHLMRERELEMDYEIQAFRVGDAAFVGLPGEPFVEGQLRIKLASPAYPTYVAHCTTQYVGYIPTREALTRGGHEVNTRYWAKLVPEALDTVVENAIAALRELFPE
jgi:neutral ceramidase